MKKSIFYLLFSLSALICKAQISTNENCYIWESKYYIGDFQKLCLFENNTFYYQSHQNDVIPDTYSKGLWKFKDEKIELISIEPFGSEKEILSSGKAIQDSLFVKIIDIETEKGLPRIMFYIYDSDMNRVDRCFADSLGIIKIQLKENYKYFKCAQYYTYNPIFFGVESLSGEYVTVKMNKESRAMIFKDISKKTIFVKSDDTLIEEYERDKFINYLRKN